ncbi:putative DNA binding domain-containing protein [bacterium]|nr:putative DNA binding domain-containing protein [bacterium]
MDILKNLENERFEFKREIPKKREKFAEEVIAFANTRGGKIVVGYDQKDDLLVGIDLKQDQEEVVANIVHDLCSPHIPYTVSLQSINAPDGEQKELLIIDIAEGVNKPYFLKNKDILTGSFVRVGSTTRRADQQTLTQLIREGKNIPYDVIPVSQQLDPDSALLHTYTERRHKRLGTTVPKQVRKAQLRDLGLYDQSTLTIAGALLLRTYPQDIPELGNSGIQMARFRDRRSDNFIDRAELLGPLPELIEQAVQFFLRNIRVASVIKGSKRKDLPDYPTEIFRELIVNAVIHRDYSVIGSSVQVAIFDDRIEFSTPGSLAGPVTVDNILERQFSRNPHIAKRMFEMGYFESWGQGMDRVMEWSEKHAERPLQIREGSGQFIVTLSARKSDKGLETSSTQRSSPPSKITEQKRAILNFIKGREHTSNKDVRESFGVSKSQAQGILRELLKGGFITKHGAGRSTHYVFKA